MPTLATLGLSDIHHHTHLGHDQQKQSDIEKAFELESNKLQRAAIRSQDPYLDHPVVIYSYNIAVLFPELSGASWVQIHCDPCLTADDLQMVSATCNLTF